MYWKFNDLINEQFIEINVHTTFPVLQFATIKKITDI